MVLILFMTNYSKTLFESAFIASFGERCFLEGPLAAYAHSLLYRCEQCTEPLVLSGEEANLERCALEIVEIHPHAQAFRPTCSKAQHHVLPVGPAGQFAQEKVDAQEVEDHEHAERGDGNGQSGSYSR